MAMLSKEARAAGHYRRFKGYDYSRGAVVFVTFAVAERRAVFGRVGAGGKLEPKEEATNVDFAHALELTVAAKEGEPAPEPHFFRVIIF